MELFLLALKSFTHRLPPTQFMFCCGGGRREGGRTLPRALPAVWAEAMAAPGRVRSSQRGHRALLQGLPSLGAPGRLLAVPQAGREGGKGGPGVDRQREGCRKPSETADGEEAMLRLLLPFFYPWCFHAGCCQSHRLFPRESWASSCLK